MCQSGYGREMIQYRIPDVFPQVPQILSLKSLSTNVPLCSLRQSRARGARPEAPVGLGFPRQLVRDVGEDDPVSALLPGPAQQCEAAGKNPNTSRAGACAPVLWAQLTGTAACPARAAITFHPLSKYLGDCKGLVLF